jgi:RNase P/RNase MRP subunit p29
LSEVTKIEGRLVAETEKAVLINFGSGREVWIPKSTLKAEFKRNKNISQKFSIDTWVLEKNNVIIDEDHLVKELVGKIKARHKDDLIAIYGIGSFFDKNLPSNWIKNDIDLILVVKSIENIPKEHWDRRFYSEDLEGFEVFSGYNTLEMYQNKDKFKEFSGANYKWAILEIKLPENSKLLYGKDIRDQLREITTLTFDYDDLLARSFYHVEKSLREKGQIAENELSKAIFKTSFYLCVYFMENFSSTSIIEIAKKIKEIVEIIRPLKDIEIFFEEAITYRSTGQFKTDFTTLQKEYINFLISLLKTGALHRKIEKTELRTYFTKFFGGFPNLIRFLEKPRSQKTIQKKVQQSGNIIANLGPDFQSVNITGKIVEIFKGHRFTRADGTIGNIASFIMEDPTGLIRVVVWNDEVRKKLFRDNKFRKHATIIIANGYIRTGYNNKIEIHVGNYGNIVLEQSPLIPSPEIKRKMSKSDIVKRLQILDIDATKISKTPCHFCGLLCSPNAKKCPKCGEPLTIKFD